MSDWNDDEYEFDATRPISAPGKPIVADECMMDWFEYKGLMGWRANEGAIFTPLGDGFVIAVHGAQFLHHDRFVEQEGLSADTWNLQVSGEGKQMLVCEVGQDVFTHIPLVRGEMVYLETTNRHMVTRTDPADVCVMMQVHGFGPDQQNEAYERMMKLYEEAIMPKDAPIRDCTFIEYIEQEKKSKDKAA